MAGSRKSLGAVYARAAGRRVPDLQSLAAYRGLGLAAGRLLHQLYLAADNYGNFFGGAGSVTEYLYPEEAPAFEAVAGWMEEIAAAGLLSFYVVCGRKFIHLTEWVERERGAIIVPLAPHQCGGDGVYSSADGVDSECVQDVCQVGDGLDGDLIVGDGVFCVEGSPVVRSASPSSSPVTPSPPPPATSARVRIGEASRFVKVSSELDAVEVVAESRVGLGCSKEEVVAVMKGCFWGGKLQDGVVIEAEAEAFLSYYRSGKDARGRRLHSWQQRAIAWLKNTQQRAAAEAVKVKDNGRCNGVVHVVANEL